MIQRVRIFKPTCFIVLSYGTIYTVADSNCPNAHGIFHNLSHRPAISYPMFDFIDIYSILCYYVNNAIRLFCQLDASYILHACMHGCINGTDS
jgi:hypothetical protein